MTSGMKYIAVDRLHSYQTLFIFPADLDHYQIANAHRIQKGEILGAGFIKWDDDGPYCHGHSTTLGIKSRGADDTLLLKRQMGYEEF